ncbi:MAG: trypsin-like peptidase domain-containing protein [Chloroflexota bacterium]|nr:MAG: trypsin-like peptidase domain-containing protein [Chloroflexota bacterium]
MKLRKFQPKVWFVILVLILLSACGSGTQEPTQEAVQSDEQVEPQETEEVEASPNEVPAEEVEFGAISSLDEAKNAVIQIEADGTFVNPDFSVSYNDAGFGSGFIIDPSGLAVTNNHVVTGAALLKVWIGGETGKTYNAKVVGVSECSDLALIDIEGDGFPYLDWHEGPINVGLEVYAAGFPLGEPQFTLTRGIVSKEEAGGETYWASVDYVIEHDATINPGNSGGPLLNADGNVVGINYSGRETDQYFAIGRDLAQDVVSQLEKGQNVEWVGINGEAFVNEDFSGIWVYSVESGSPADKAGIEGGDIITMVESLILATDGTMADYCDVLRSHDSDDTLDLEVLRYSTGEVLDGQLNGRELETTVTFTETIEEDIETVVEDAGTYSGYVSVMDDYGAIQMDIPAEWTDVYGGFWDDEGETIGSTISAAADLDAYINSWSESGVFFGASDDLAKLGGYVNLLDVRRDFLIDECKYDTRYDYEDVAFRGKYDLYENCGGSGNVYIVLTAVPINDPQAFLVLVEMQITKDSDFEALDQILATFDVVGSLP